MRFGQSEFDLHSSPMGSLEVPDNFNPKDLEAFQIPPVIDPKYFAASDWKVVSAASSLTSRDQAFYFTMDYVDLTARPLEYYMAELLHYLVLTPATSLAATRPESPIEKAIHLGEDQNYAKVFEALSKVSRDEELWHKYLLTHKYLDELSKVDAKRRQFQIQMDTIAKEIVRLTRPDGLLTKDQRADLNNYILRKQDGMYVAPLWEQNYGPLTRAYEIRKADTAAQNFVTANKPKVDQLNLDWNQYSSELNAYNREVAKTLPRRELVLGAQAKLVLEYCERHPEMWLRLVSQKIEDRTNLIEAHIENLQAEKEAEVRTYEPIYNVLWQKMGDDFLNENSLRANIEHIEKNIQETTHFLEHGHDSLVADIEYLNNTGPRLEKWINESGRIDPKTEALKGTFEYLYDGKKFIFDANGMHYTIFQSQIVKLIEEEVKNIEKRVQDFPHKWESLKNQLPKLVAIYDRYKAVYDERLTHINGEGFIAIVTRVFTQKLYESRRLAGLEKFVPGDIQAKYEAFNPLEMVIKIPRPELDSLIAKAKTMGFKETAYKPPQSSITIISSIQKELMGKVDVLFKAIERKIIEKTGLEIPNYAELDMQTKRALFKGATEFLQETTPKMPQIDYEMKVIRKKMSLGEASEEEATAFVAAQSLIKNYALCSKVVKDLADEIEAFEKSVERVEGEA